MRPSLLLQYLEDHSMMVFETPFSSNLAVVRGKGGPGDFDGSIHLAYYTDKGGVEEHAWPAATRPGLPGLRRPQNKDGTAVIAPGQYRLAYRRGLHRGRPALIQVGNVDVYRDNDRDKALDPSRRRYTGLFGVNIHDTENPDTLLGCIGMHPPHMAELLYLFEHVCERVSEHATLSVLGEEP